MKDLQDGRDESPESYAYRGEHLQHMGRYEDALEAFREALSRDPDNVQLLRQLAHCQLNSDNEKPAALDTIDRAIRLQSDNATNHALRSLILVSLKKYREAINAANTAIAMEPEEALGHAVLAQAHLQRDSWSMAEDSARQALSLDPDHVMAANVLAHVLFRQGKQTENEVHIAGDAHA